MNFITFVLTVLLFACVASAEDCASKFNVTAEDWKQLKKDTAHPSEKILCMLKCEYESDGALNPDKTINAEKLVKKITAWKHLDEPIKAELKECVQKVKVPLNTCANMKPYFDCVRTAENEQDNKNGEECASKFNVTAFDWLELKKDTAHPSEKILCMLKCEYENDGALNPDKTINAEKLVKKITSWKHLDESIKAELKECVQKVKVPLNTCANMKPYYDCVRTAENEQNGKNCASKFNVTADDWNELNEDIAHPSEKILCMLKCEYENDGALNPDKTINAEKLVKKFTSWKDLDEPIKAELKECVQKVKVPLNTCANMKPYFDCVRTAENEQDKKNGEDCAAKFNVTADDWTELKKDTAHPSEKILCMLKCEYENDGALNPDKTINAEKLVKKITAWKHLDEPIKAELKECVQKVKVPLNTCANMKPYFDCVRTAENEQDNKVSKA